MVAFPAVKYGGRHFFAFKCTSCSLLYTLVIAHLSVPALSGLVVPFNLVPAAESIVRNLYANLCVGPVDSVMLYRMVTTMKEFIDA